MYAQLSEPPPLLTARRPDLPAAVDAVFARALAKAPADRYASCREFADALREAFGIRPYDSGPGMVPSGEHPATRVVSAPESGPEGACRRPIRGPGGPATGGRLPGTGQPVGPPVGAGTGGPGQIGNQATQLAGSAHGTTSPDLTAGHWPPDTPGGGYGGGYGGGPARSRWRSPALIAVIVIIVLLGGGGGAYYALKGPAKKTTTGSGFTFTTAPGCSTVAAKAQSLTHLKGAMTTVPDTNPFGLEATQDGKFLFVVNDTTVLAYGTGPGGTLTYKWHYTVANSGEPATGSVLTNNGKYMLVAAANGIVVLSVANGEAGASSMQVATLTVPNQTKYERAIQVAVSPDDKFAFVTLQFANLMGVFSLGDAATTGDFSAATFVGSVKLGKQPVGMAASPDGKYLYVTSFQSGPQSATGLLNVLSLPEAEKNPAGSVKAQVPAATRPGSWSRRIRARSGSAPGRATTCSRTRRTGWSPSPARH